MIVEKDFGPKAAAAAILIAIVATSSFAADTSSSASQREWGLSTGRTAATVSSATSKDNTQNKNDGPTVTRQQLEQEMLLLRRQYNNDLRKLRALDLKLKALTGSDAHRSTAAPSSQQTSGQHTTPASPPSSGKQVGTDRKKARDVAAISRNVEDLIDAEHPSFNQTFTLESALDYSRYDRTQLTLNGFLALDAIFLGNLAVEGVASDTLTYSLTARYGVSNRMVLNLTTPLVYRSTTYAKGGVGGVATATSETDVTRQPALGDASFGMSYRLLPTARKLDWVWNIDITAPTGKHPYGVPVQIIEKDQDGVTTFSVPANLPTGSGVWSLNTGVSFVRVSDPAVLFGNFGIGYTRKESFSDVDSDPATRTAGDIDLGDSVSYGLGMAIAMNENTSLSLSFSHKLTSKTRTRTAGSGWTSVTGSDANSAMFNTGVTQSLGKHLSIAGTVGIGLTDDAPDFTFGLRMPYRF